MAAKAEANSRLRDNQREGFIRARLAFVLSIERLMRNSTPRIAMGATSSSVDTALMSGG